jgi:hypothetical protein
MRIRRHSSNVYVISTDDPGPIRKFFEALGLVFVDEKHGGGPAHVSCERNSQVLEIYPQRGRVAADASSERASSSPPYDPTRWFNHVGCEGRHYVHEMGNPHTFPGRMLGWCPKRDGSFFFSKSEIAEASPETMHWVDGFLAGAEPAPPHRPEGGPDYESEAGREWADRIRAFRTSGAWETR